MFLHGADYNPEQWLKYPEILKRDIELMKEAKCNVMSVGIFAWSKLEPEEGVYTFEWLDEVINNLYQAGISVILATPSGARPSWLAQKYQEVLRVESNRVRNLYGFRHNHCYTSPIYREKVRQMNIEIAKRYAHHPGVIMWHISNEYGGDCHCELCQEAFREWLQAKYRTLEELNDRWWSTFWSHPYTDWRQIESPAPHGEYQVHALNLDWKRFVTDRTIDFMEEEIKAVRSYNPALPVTTNMMFYEERLNYFKFKDKIDIISWDAYPEWHDPQKSDREVAMEVAAFHDIMRSLKKQPFMLMESTPSMTNWQRVSKLKKPGMHRLSSLQAVAHGSDTVQYFQWRKSRGSSEKLHGAVVDHDGRSDHRVFKDVKEVGITLETISEIQGANVHSEVAIVYDWENRWAIADSQGPRNIGMKYHDVIMDYYRPFWKQGVSVDFVDQECSLKGYKLVVAPMLYLLKEAFAEEIKKFVASGGALVLTYWSGIVDSTDLCYLGGFPGELMEVVGVRSREIDGLFDGQINHIVLENKHGWQWHKQYKCYELCDLIEVETATVLGTYTEDFYKDKAVLTENSYGKGKAYYIGAKTESAFQEDFFRQLMEKIAINPHLNIQLPEGVVVSKRTKENKDYLFILNFTEEVQEVVLDKKQYQNLIKQEVVSDKLRLEAYEVAILC